MTEVKWVYDRNGWSIAVPTGIEPADFIRLQKKRQLFLTQPERVDMPWIADDGGRAAAGFKGSAGDCAVRAISIATGREYKATYDMLHGLMKVREAVLRERGKNIRSGSPRTGVPREIVRAFMLTLGWKWVPTMGIGTGCRVHLRSDELPAGRLIVALSRHYAAVIDGVIHDTYNPSRGGTRCVYGYFVKGSEG